MQAPGSSVKLSLPKPTASLISNSPKLLLRSLGDGMEQPNHQENGKELIQETVIPVHTEIPMPVNKPLKFIPHEPYKAAVTSLVGGGEFKRHSPKSKTIVTQGPTLKETHILFPLHYPKELKKGDLPLVKVLRQVPPATPEQETPEKETPPPPPCDCAQEKLALQEEVEKLKEQNRELQQQFLIQTQVNGEIKKLLVASLGEDMQERVQFLTEDKANLGQHIAHYSQLLSEDREELERLSIQCDIWRSKFLASSLMVDELAGWKAKLLGKYEEALESIAWIFEEHKELKLNLISTQRKLRLLRNTYDPMAGKHAPAPSCTLLSLAQGARHLTEDLSSRLLGPLPPHSLEETSWNLSQLWTPAEKRAKEVLAAKESILSMPSSIQQDTDNILDWRNHSGPPSLLPPAKFCRFHSCVNSSSVTGCSHCSGDMKVV